MPITPDLSDVTDIELDEERDVKIAVNLKTLEMLGINLDNYVVVGDEIVSLSDGTLIKAGS